MEQNGALSPEIVGALKSLVQIVRKINEEDSTQAF